MNDEMQNDFIKDDIVREKSINIGEVVTDRGKYIFF